MQYERPKTGEIVVFHVWPDVTILEIEKIRRTLKAHSQFQRLRKLDNSLTSLPRWMEIYQDDVGDRIGFIHKNLNHEKNLIISSPGSSPIVEDILGSYTATF